MADRGDYIAAHADTLGALADVCARLDNDQWLLPTGCPGWAVRDQVAHVCDLESLIGGLTQAPQPVEIGGHVMNAIGARMEPGIIARRSLPTDELLAELQAVTKHRLDQLAQFPEERLEDIAHGHPLGPMPFRMFFTLRVWDLFAHEQDVRRAVDQRGHGSGPAPEITVRFSFTALARLLHEKAPEMHGRRMHIDVEGLSATLDFTGDRATAHVPAENPPWAMVFDIGNYLAWISGRSDRDDFSWYGKEPAGDDLRLAHEAFRAHAGLTP